MELRERSWKLVVAPHTTQPGLSNFETGLDVSGLSIKFRIHKTLKPKPNTANIEIFGLSKDSRQYLQFTKVLDVRLEAGYNDENELLYLGQTRHAFVERKGPDIITFLETGTNEKDMAAAGIHVTYGAQMSLQTAFQAIQSSLPNIQPFFPISSQSQAAAFIMHPVGGAVSRMTTRVLTDYCRSAGLEWSIQDGSLLILTKGQPMKGKQILISADTGMIGSPSVNHKGEVRVTSLIIPGLHPGAPFHLDSETFKGDFRIESAHYSGDTSPGARDWYVHITGNSV